MSRSSRPDLSALVHRRKLIEVIVPIGCGLRKGSGYRVLLGERNQTPQAVVLSLRLSAYFVCNSHTDPAVRYLNNTSIRQRSHRRPPESIILIACRRAGRTVLWERVRPALKVTHGIVREIRLSPGWVHGLRHLSPPIRIICPINRLVDAPVRVVQATSRVHRAITISCGRGGARRKFAAVGLKFPSY